MKVSVDDKELFTLSDTQKRVIMDNVRSEIFEEDMKRRLQWVLMHKYEQCYEDLKKEWDPKLKNDGVAMIPLNPDAYAQLVFSRPSYMSRSERDATEKPLVA
jgi:hypothetical protein